MAFSETADEIRSRIAKAERDRDRFLAARMQEQYLAASSTVDALGLQLDRLEALDRNPATTGAPAPNPGNTPDAPPPDVRQGVPRSNLDGQEQQMSMMGVRFDGRQYRYRTYRYDRLSDALNYARLQPAPAPDGQEEEAFHDIPREALPDESQNHLMAQLGITRQDGRYCYREYRYDRWADAVAYAQLPKTPPTRCA